MTLILISVNPRWKPNPTWRQQRPAIGLILKAVKQSMSWKIIQATLSAFCIIWGNQNENKLTRKPSMHSWFTEQIWHKSYNTSHSTPHLNIAMPFALTAALIFPSSLVGIGVNLVPRLFVIWSNSLSDLQHTQFTADTTTEKHQHAHALK